MIPLIFAIGIISGAFGSILMKIGAQHMGAVHIDSFVQFLQFVLGLFLNWWTLCGMVLYFVSAIMWAYLLTKMDVSSVQPILALTYVLTPILAVVLIHENVPLLRWIGVLVVIIGVVIVARSSV